MKTISMIVVLLIVATLLAVPGALVNKTSIAPAAAQELNLPELNFSPGFYTAYERDGTSERFPSGDVPTGEGTIKIVLTLSHATDKDVSVKVTCIGSEEPGSTHRATGDVDYFDFTHIFTIPAGQTKLEIPLWVYADDIVEGDEYVGFGMCELVNATKGSQSEASLKIIDDDTSDATPTATTSPTASPTASPTTSPTASPTASPTTSPTASPTASPTTSPTASPTASAPSKPLPATIRYMWAPEAPTPSPSVTPTANPSVTPTPEPSVEPTPTEGPTLTPTPASTTTPEQDGSNIVLWLALLIIAIVAAGLAYYLIRKK